MAGRSRCCAQRCDALQERAALAIQRTVRVRMLVGALLLAVHGCGLSGPEHPDDDGVLALGATSTVTRATRTSSLSTPAQRHMVRVRAGAAPVLLLAVDRGSSLSPSGLQWYRSDDDGLTWRTTRPFFRADRST